MISINIGPIKTISCTIKDKNSYHSLLPPNAPPQLRVAPAALIVLPPQTPSIRHVIRAKLPLVGSVTLVAGQLDGLRT